MSELLVITASILLAFALEAWWSDRSDRRRFEELLGAVRIELSGARDELARARAIHEGTVQALDSILGLMGPAPDVEATERFFHNWEDVRFTSTDVPKGVLSNLLATGDISALRDSDLRVRLSAWPAAVEDHVATELMYANALEGARARLSERTPIPPGWGAEDYQTAFPFQPSAALTDFRVENELARTLLLLRVVVAENEQLGRDADAILDDLTSFLASR